MFGQRRSVARYERAVRAIWRPGRESYDGSIDMQELVRCATLAASSHNTQPWKFKIHGRTITILPDYTRRCPAVDPDDSHLFKSLGCAVENLAQAAAAQGHVAHVRFEPATDSLTIELEGSMSTRASVCFHGIPHRQCVRLPYTGQALDSRRVAELEAVSTEGDVRPLFLTSCAQLDSMVELVREGNRSQFADQDFLNELQAWVRFNLREAIRTADGLAGLVSGEPAIPTWAGQLLFKRIASATKQSERDAINIRSSAGVVVFVGLRDEKASWIDAGRAYQRFALRAAAWQIRSAFINQPIEVRNLRPQLLSWLQMEGQCAHLIVRYGEGPAVPHSMRRPLEQVLV